MRYHEMEDEDFGIRAVFFPFLWIENCFPNKMWKNSELLHIMIFANGFFILLFQRELFDVSEFVNIKRNKRFLESNYDES